MAEVQIQFLEVFPFYFTLYHYIPFLSYQELCREKTEFVAATFCFLPETQTAQIYQLFTPFATARNGSNFSSGGSGTAKNSGKVNQVIPFHAQEPRVCLKQDPVLTEIKKRCLINEAGQLGSK